MSSINASTASLTIINNVEPILKDYEIQALLADGWIKCVTDLERKWADIVALAFVSDNPASLETLPRARWLREKSRLLVKDPAAYLQEECWFHGDEAYKEFAKNP